MQPRAPLFSPSSDFFLRAGVFGAVLALAGGIAVAITYYRSAYFTQVSFAPDQPVPFSHAHHVGMIGLDCRYCHRTATEFAFAGIPETSVCMNCHAKLFADAPVLEPIRHSFRTGKPMLWRRVHDLPDHVYFDHSVHVKNGVACITCHGQVDQMPLIRKAGTLTMKWCLDCHRQPAPLLSPPNAIFSTKPISPAVMSMVMALPANVPATARYAAAKASVENPRAVYGTTRKGLDEEDSMTLYQIDTRGLLNCTACHR